jgi:hypothetical protein
MNRFNYQSAVVISANGNLLGGTRRWRQYPEPILFAIIQYVKNVPPDEDHNWEFVVYPSEVEVYH